MTLSPGLLLALVLPVVPGFGGVTSAPSAAPAAAVTAAAPGTPPSASRRPAPVDEPPLSQPAAEPAGRGQVSAPFAGPAQEDLESPAQDPEAIARRADQALATLRSLRAAFVQEVTNPLLEKTTTGRGAILYQAPDRFRIAYSDPPGDVVVHDGSRVWIYLPSSQPGQVIRQPAAASGVQNPLTYLRDLRQQHTVRYGGVETITGRAADRLDLQPRGRAAFTRVEVWVDRESGLLRQVRTRTEDGIVTTYTFSTLERNVRLDAGSFRFTPPHGVEVFDS